ncbi:MAG: glycosyltransferase family 2 protein [Vicinamibacterales bacterium]
MNPVTVAGASGRPNLNAPEVWVTVLMPVYNGERYIAQAIESVLGQTHQAFEFLIIDDGSTDNTRRILAEYASLDTRIRVVRHANVGQPATLNRGLSLARHDWVAIIDHDDAWLPRRLERQLPVLERVPDVRLVGTWAKEINAAGVEIGTRCTGPTSAEEFRAFDAAGQRVPITHPSVLMHRPTVLALGGYDPRFGSAADTELWTRVARVSAIVVVPEPLLFYRIHSQSMSFRRMFEQREMLRWIVARDRERRRGRRVPSLAQFRAARPLWRLRLWRERQHDLFWFFRSYCLLAVAEGRVVLSASLAICAAAVAPQNAMRVARRRLRERLPRVAGA